MTVYNIGDTDENADWLIGLPQHKGEVKALGPPPTKRAVQKKKEHRYVLHVRGVIK